MTRRRAVFAVVGVAAAALGVGGALWRERRLATLPPTGLPPAEGAVAGAGTGAVVVAADAGDLWQLRFPKPNGGELVMAEPRGRPLVLNFWATWCPPCVKEMPELERFYQARRASGWQVVGLAVDGPTPVRQFLDRVAIAFPIGLAGLEGTDLSRRLGNATGALPFTIVFDKDGQPLHRKLGETSFDELERWAAAR